MWGLPFWIGKSSWNVTGIFPLKKKKKGNIVELKNKTPIKALPLFSECSREFGYRNMGGTKILL